MTVHRHPWDRICTHVGPEGGRCITRLCRLNPEGTCFAHTPVKQLPPRVAMEAFAYEQFMRTLPTAYQDRSAA
jgi:hypothetical protein